MSWTLYCARIEDWTRAHREQKFHAVLCDPPYGLEFMGKEWDQHNDYQGWTRQWASALIPLLYPGALVFCFGGTRTWHRLACGFEDAGFQIWDTLMWLQGQGFPKAQDISKMIDDSRGLKRNVLGQSPNWRESKRDREQFGSMEIRGENAGLITESVDGVSAPWSGHKTAALKPAWEPILCFKAPTQGKTYAELAMEYGSGALNVDGGRIGLSGETPPSGSAKRVLRANQFTNEKLYGDNTTTPHLGRYPANLTLDEEAAAMLDAQAGEHPGSRVEKPCLNPEIGGYVWGTLQSNRGPRGFNDNGGPSRFFYCAKASRGERAAGLEKPTGGIANDHPTVKPLSLCRWLAALLLPANSAKPRRLFVPFAGSGSDIIGALQAGWDDVVGVEMDNHYCQIARGRLLHWIPKSRN